MSDLPTSPGIPLPPDGPVEMPLGDEELRPVPNLLERMNAAASAPGMSAPTTAPRRRGRPAGSKNKTTLANESLQGVRVSPVSRLVTPPPRVKPEPDSDEVAAAKREAKAKRVEELTESIGEKLNEQIILGLTSLGVPGELLYKPGMAPKSVASNSKYSDFAGNVLLSPMQVGSYAKFVAELEQTDIGKKASGVTGNSNIGLILYGGLSFLATIQYLQGLKTFSSELKPLIEQYRAMEMARQSDIDQPNQQQ